MRSKKALLFEKRSKNFCELVCVLRQLWCYEFSRRPQLSDPNDEMVLDAAINGRAEALVTHNQTDFADAARRFGVNVMAPGTPWKRMIT
jgi:predicted nucleic acid-binding protein